MTPVRIFSICALAFCLSACGNRNDEPIIVDEIREEEPGGGSEEPGGTVNPGQGACASDGDCVPAACCHPDQCVARAQGPDCSDTMCTQECRYGTLDCGGSCFCQDGTCAARLSEAPAIEVH